MKKNKLELTWIGKDKRPKLEPRILLEDPSKSYHAKQRVTDNDIFDNKLIFGDNLLALKALEQEYSGKVKCIYVDPPFNTGQAFENYDDGLEHSIWLSLIRDRVEILHNLLSVDGTFAIHIDDNELGYLIVIIDEIFGRSNRTYIATFKQSSVSGPKSINPGLVSTTSFIVIYAKDKRQWKPNKLYAPTARDSRYSKYIENYLEEYSKWRLIPLMEAYAKSVGVERKELKKIYTDKLEGNIEKFVLSEPSRVVRTARVAEKDIADSGKKMLRSSDESRDKVFKATRDNRPDIYFLNGEQLIFYSSKAKEIDGDMKTAQALSTLWDDLLSNNLHKEGGVRFPNGKKPERLLKRILEMTTKPGDLVLDSFGGSGTTAAVAHKMLRKWITIELGDHCDTHIHPRMKRVVNGSDQDGISKIINWNGGGGFRYFTLAPSLLEKDKWGNWVVNKAYNAEMLSEAICKLEGFTYSPSGTEWWNHGHSTETDFIYVTTQMLTVEKLQQLSDEVGGDKTLLVCCSSFRCKADRFPNLTIKKIPKMVLSRCEWAHDDYSLNVENLPQMEKEPEQQDMLRADDD
ncbi:MAG: site-specific DNA-methyltransferase [Methylococcales bacterium]